MLQMQNLEEYNAQYTLWEVQKLEVLAITNISKLQFTGYQANNCPFWVSD